MTMPEKSHAGRDDSAVQEGVSAEKARRPQRDTATPRAQQKAITQGLRRFYDTVGAEPVPAEFMDLLKRLDAESGAV